jgi:hypothetical protein
VVNTFSGTELDRYFQDVMGHRPIDALLYRQVNLYAHQRFPHELVFVHNLLAAYSTDATRDAVAWEQLIRKYWYYDVQLRSRFFEFLSSNGRLDAELASLGKLNAVALSDRASTQIISEAQAWRSHFENAAPVMRLIAGNYPGEEALQTRTAALYRSLAAFDSNNTGIASAIEERVANINRRNTQALATVGDIYADREAFQKAKPYWTRIAAVDPGRPDGYVEAATVFWDYYLFDDALALLQEGRTKLKNPALFSYEAGAIYENKREYPTGTPARAP